jgi:hypothetical protein
MRTSNEFDRISTPEELHQVLAVLSDLAPAWTFSPDLQFDAQVGAVDEDVCVDDPADEISVVESLLDKPYFKN